MRENTLLVEDLILHEGQTSRLELFPEKISHCSHEKGQHEFSGVGRRLGGGSLLCFFLAILLCSIAVHGIVKSGVHACDSCTHEAKQEDNKLKATLDYIARSCLKK